MWLSDQSVKRPIFATVLNLLLVVFGLFSIAQLSVREYPDIDIPVVWVETRYTGASAAIMKTQVTQTLENQLAGIEGVRAHHQRVAGRPQQHQNRIRTVARHRRRGQRRARPRVTGARRIAGTGRLAAHPESRRRCLAHRLVRADQRPDEQP
tara:strand:- start:857 stop:1312 length:456 start_codon:yes stop_codon:yes gene_type:complete